MAPLVEGVVHERWDLKLFMVIVDLPQNISNDHIERQVLQCGVLLGQQQQVVRDNHAIRLALGLEALLEEHQLTDETSRADLLFVQQLSIVQVLLDLFDQVLEHVQILFVSSIVLHRSNEFELIVARTTDLAIDFLEVRRVTHRGDVLTGEFAAQADQVLLDVLIVLRCIFGAHRRG